MIEILEIGKGGPEMIVIIIKIERMTNILVRLNTLPLTIILIVKVHQVDQVFIQVKMANIKVLREVEVVMTNVVIVMMIEGYGNHIEVVKIIKEENISKRERLILKMIENIQIK